MFHTHSLSKSCTVLAVLCGKHSDKLQRRDRVAHDTAARYPYPVLESSGRLEVHTLVNPSTEKFREVKQSLAPSFLYLQGEQLENGDEIGSLAWGGNDVSDPAKLTSLIGSPSPTIVYLEIPSGEKLAKALHSEGIPYVIYWRNGFSPYAASHFLHSLLSVVQSSYSHTWDAFQLASASFKLYCSQSNKSPVKQNNIVGPSLLGEAPKIDVAPAEKLPSEEAEITPDDLPAIKIYDNDMDMKFLICGSPTAPDLRFMGSLADGLNALLNIEIRGSKLQNRVSAAPPPLQAGTFSRGVVTMRCDLATCSSAHISLLVSGSAQTCFDDQALECHIKNELIEKNKLVHAQLVSEKNKHCLAEPRKSSSIACGSSVVEVCMKLPVWAAQVLKQLAREVSYRSLIALGIASIQGSPVASFEKEDAERFLFFCKRPGSTGVQDIPICSPKWFRPPAPSRKRLLPADQEMKQDPCTFFVGKGLNGIEERNPSLIRTKQIKKVAAMRPVPRVQQHKMLPFSGLNELGSADGNITKPNMPIVPSSKHIPPAPVTHRKSKTPSSFHAQQIISLNPLPLKKHGCARPPIQACSEEEFLRDVMEFLILRGHHRLVPQGGISEFPDAILNAKRLDLYNLYREVVSRGGFHVGNGINWKGQVFSKMRNHTVTNRMTGVGNTLKRHYETYLLEYELAHDDVDGECCLLCQSSAPGDWVNCGLCGEWAHFGCDRRPGLGAFKDYAKTDGLEYICPHCSLASSKKKSQKVNGFPQGSGVSRLI